MIGYDGQFIAKDLARAPTGIFVSVKGSTAKAEVCEYHSCGKSSKFEGMPVKRT
jgi:hypothetical protein